jgi:hypothetical protein
MRLTGFAIAFGIFATLLSVWSSNALAALPPSALQAGSNDGTADSFVGNHVWTFDVKPGHFELDVTEGRVPTNALPGAPFVVQLHVVPLKGNHVTFMKAPGGYVFRGDMTKSAHMSVTVIPASSTLVRVANEYTIEATGSVVFGAATDPILGTYTGADGALRFLPGGVIKTASGQDGQWTVFDPQLHVYTVVLGQTRYSLKLSPGQGLLDAGNGNIVFQSVH